MINFIFLFQIPFSLNVEMWGEGDADEKQCFDLFNPPNEQLEVRTMQGLPQLHSSYIPNYIPK